MKKRLTKLLSVLLSLSLAVSIIAPAAASFAWDAKWDFARLSIIGGNETLSESYYPASGESGGLDSVYRAYNPNTERGILTFGLRYTQPVSVEVWTRELWSDWRESGDPQMEKSGGFVGYIQGIWSDDGEAYIFDEAEGFSFKGYAGLLPELVESGGADPYDDRVIDERNFINAIIWDGEVADEYGEAVELSDDEEYVVVVQPLTESEAENRLYLGVKIDRNLPPQALGAPYGAAAPFEQLFSLPGQHNVNMITGNYTYSSVDLAVTGADSTAIERTYNSTDNYTGIFGYGWRSGYDYLLEESELTVRVYMPDGTQYDFALRNDGSYVSPLAYNAELEKNGGSGFTLTDRNKTAYEFDESGKILSITKLNGFTTAFAYSGDRLNAITGRSGTLTLDYNADGYVGGISASSGRSVSYEYDVNGNLIAFTTPENKTLVYGYDGGHNLIAFTDGSGRTCLELGYDEVRRVEKLYINASASPCEIEYDVENRRTMASDAAGNEYTYAYNRDRRIVEFERPSGTTYSIYNDEGRLVESVSPSGTIRYEYDVSGNTTKTILPDNSGTKIEYNENNLPVTVTNFDSDEAAVSVTSYTYDENGNITTQTDANGNVTSYEYDADNNCVKSTDSNGNATEFEYDIAGRLTGITTPDGESVAMAYNADGKLASETSALGYKIEYAYDADGNLASKTDPLGNVTRYETDGNGRTTAQIDASGNRTEWTYDSAGHILTTTDAEGNVTEYTYDSNGRQLTQTDPNDGVVTYHYDADGRVAGMTDASGNRWTYEYSAEGYQTGLTDPYGGEFSAAYDSLGRMVGSADANNHTTEFEYDSEGRVTLVTNPLGGTREYEYDANGNAVSEVDENGSEWKYEYNSDNMLVKQTDPLGNDVLFEYDERGRLTAIESSLGSTQTFTYDADGRTESFTDAEGNTTAYSYDALARLTKVEYQDGTFIEYAYDALGRMTEFKGLGGTVSHYEYDKIGRLVKYTNALGGETSYAYDGNGNITKRADTLGNETLYSYDANNNLLEVEDALGGKTSYTYDKLNRLTKSKDALNNITEYEYDSVGNLIKIILPDGSAAVYEYDANDRLISAELNGEGSEISYDAVGNITSASDALGNETELTYDALNRNTLVETPDGGKIRYEYDADGRVKSVTQKVDDSRSAVTEFTYDKNNRAVRIEDALGHSRTITYDDVGQVISETDENNNTSYYSYDAAGNLIKYTDAVGNITQYGYDALGRLISETAPRGGLGIAASVTSYKYDALNRVVSVTDPMDNTVRLSYDALSRITEVTDAAGGKTGYEYDALGNVVKTTDALGNAAMFEYDPMGRLTKANTPDGQMTLYTYDKNGLVASIIDPARGESVNVYDANGNLTQSTDANGNVTEYEYDPLNRVRNITYSDGKSVNYAYNSAGQLVEMTDWTGTTTLASDLLGQLLSVTDPQGKTVAYTWDNAGNKSSVTAPDGAKTEYSYNKNNQLSAVKDANGGVTNYDYLDSTLLNSVSHPNSGKTVFTYNSNGQPLTEIHSLRGKETRTYSYRYDEKGRLISEARTGIGIGVSPYSTETYEYRYDALDRLISSKGSGGETVTYGCDAMGNMLEEASSLYGAVSYGYNAQGQLVSKTDSAGEYGYTYDKAGNLLAETLNGVLNKSFEYDASGRFVKGTNANSETTAYTYNGLGYRVQNITTRLNPNYGYRDSANGAGTTHIGSIDDNIAAWSVQDDDIYSWFDASGKVRQTEWETVAKSYVPDLTSGGLRDIMVYEDGFSEQRLTYGLGLIGVDTLITEPESSVQSVVASERNTRLYAHQDRLGANSRFTYTDGTLTTYNEFDPWGTAYTIQPEDVNYSGLSASNGYTGYTYDAVLDMYFAQARMYDSVNRRFTMPDPIGGSVLEVKSLNPYVYCQNDPVNNIDPSGMYMPGDEKLGLTPEQVQAISVLSDAWFAAQAAGDQAGMTAAHAAADAIRNGTAGGAPIVPSPTPPVGGNPPAPYPYPPTVMNIVVDALENTIIADPVSGRVSNAAQFISGDMLKAMTNSLANVTNTYLFNVVPLPKSPLTPGNVVQLDAVIQKLADWQDANDAISRLSGNSNLSLLKEAALTMTTTVLEKEILNSHLNDYYYFSSIFDEVATKRQNTPNSDLAELIRIANATAAFIKNGLNADTLTDIQHELLHFDNDIRWDACMYQMTVAEAMDLCFDGDTTVKTLNGDKKIKDVTVGDFVLSRDEETGEQDYKRVTKRFVNESTELVHITVGGATISATPSHPFFADGKGWVYAGQLEPGDVLLTAENEQVSVTDIATEHFDEPQTTYNLEVEDWHTYFVSAVGVWAHNRCVNGYFGDPAKTSDVRHMQGGILAALSLFNEITEGYTTENIIYYKTGAIKGYVREMPGGGKVTYRMSSTSDGTPVININGMLDEYYIKNQKIHFLP